MKTNPNTRPRFTRCYKIQKSRLSLLFWILLMLSYVFFIPGISLANSEIATGMTYYVNCAGSDSNNGTSATSAWKTLNKANNTQLHPGDRLLFKRGCTWAGTLEASWNGTSTAPVTIGAYGTGNLPKIKNPAGELADKHYNAVNITGSYQIIEYIETTVVNAPTDPGCRDQTVGFYSGFTFSNHKNLNNGGSFNTLRYSKATHFTAGTHTARNTHNNRIMRNTFVGNNVMHILTNNGGTDDLGAWGILLKGRSHEVGYNYLENNVAWCAYDTSPQGNAIELYEAVDNIIHHNKSINDQTFSELGGTIEIQTDNNRFVHNLAISSRTYARFLVVRGGESNWGPTSGTKAFQNTIYYTGAEGQGIVCGAGCSNGILVAQNNIIWAEEKAMYADAAFIESNNLYWSSNGHPIVQFQGFNMSPSSIVSNPKFIDVANQDFRLQSGSPAINTGIAFEWEKDLDNIPLPKQGAYDIGAYEYYDGIQMNPLLDWPPPEDEYDLNQGGYNITLPLVIFDYTIP